MAAFDDVCTTEAPSGSTSAVRAVTLVRIGDDVYAIGDRCSHADVSLSGGEVDVDDCTLECPKHGSAFDLRIRALPDVPAGNLECGAESPGT